MVSFQANWTTGTVSSGYAGCQHGDERASVELNDDILGRHRNNKVSTLPPLPVMLHRVTQAHYSASFPNSYKGLLRNLKAPI
jgi:hypothetical protein